MCSSLRVLSGSVGAAILLYLILESPKSVLYLLDLVSPISGAIKQLLLRLVPLEVPDFALQVGNWLGRQTRRALSYAGARQEVIGRLLLIDGLLVWSIMSLMLYCLAKAWAKHVFVRWLDRNYAIIDRVEYDALQEDLRSMRAVADQLEALAQAPTPQLPPESVAAEPPKLPRASQLVIPPRS
jgi:hypothetical protein